MSKKDIIKTKAEFVKLNAVKLYHLSNYSDKSSENDYTVLENLLSILLSDKPLGLCPRYSQIQSTLSRFEDDMFEIQPGENYALKTIFSTARYLNSAIENNDTKTMLRNRLRQYCKYMDNYTLSEGEIRFPTLTVDGDVKVKMKRG